MVIESFICYQAPYRNHLGAHLCIRLEARTIQGSSSEASEWQKAVIWTWSLQLNTYQAMKSSQSFKASPSKHFILSSMKEVLLPCVFLLFPSSSVCSLLPLGTLCHTKVWQQIKSSSKYCNCKEMLMFTLNFSKTFYVRIFVMLIVFINISARSGAN